MIGYEEKYDSESKKDQDKSFRLAPQRGRPDYIKERPKPLTGDTKELKSIFDIFSLSRKFNPYPEPILFSEIAAYCSLNNIGKERAGKILRIIPRLDAFQRNLIYKKLNEKTGG